MTFAEFCDGIGISPDAYAAWHPAWEENQATYDEDRLLFVSPAFVGSVCHRIAMSDEVIREVVRAAAAVERNPLLSRLVWHLFRRLSDSENVLQAGVASWPSLPPGIVSGGDMLMLFPLLARLPQLEEAYAETGITRSIFLDTMSDFELWIREHHTKTGIWGFSRHSWLVQHLAMNLFRIGRLQYQFGTFHHDFHAFRHRKSGHVLLLAGDGMPISAEGWIGTLPAGNMKPAVYHRDAAGIEGWPVLPEGRVVSRVISLSAADWEPVLEKGDPVLNLHIPAGEPMDHMACGESVAAAGPFFAGHYPEFRFQAFACGSWLLDPQLEEYLAPTANLVRFMQEFYLHPLPGASGAQIEERVFGGPLADLDEAPRNTSLRRAVIAHLKAGRKWRAGGCLLFPRDLAWGTCVYRTQASSIPEMSGIGVRAPGQSSPSEPRSVNPSAATRSESCPDQ